MCGADFSLHLHTKSGFFVWISAFDDERMETSLGPTAPRNQRVPQGDVLKKDVTSAFSQRKGESGKNIPSWYVVRGVFGKAAAFHRYLQENGRESFFPMRFRKGKTTQKPIPAIPNLCFVRGTRSEVYALIDAPLNQMHGLSQYLTPCIDPATKQIMCVPDVEMQRFMDAFSIIGDNAVWLDPKTLNLKEGEHVRVTDGRFKGIEGHIKRILGQQRVVVTLQNFVAIATAYVPSHLIERIEK